MNIHLFKTELPTRSKRPSIALAIMLFICASSFTPMNHAQTAPPPTLGENTKGEPAIVEEEQSSGTNAVDEVTNQVEQAQEETQTSPFGTATIKESKRESGQVYRVELEHSAGAKQIIEENDSDGSLESTSKDIDDTPNLPKWKLGSW